jgi:hypothetical protein
MLAIVPPKPDSTPTPDKLIKFGAWGKAKEGPKKGKAEQRDEDGGGWFLRSHGGAIIVH